MYEHEKIIWETVLFDICVGKTEINLQTPRSLISLQVDSKLAPVSSD